MRRPKRGRRPLSPEDRNSELLNVRVRPSVRRNLERLAKKRGGSVSRQMQRAFDYWIERNLHRAAHIEALGWLVMNLASEVERGTKKRWTDDADIAEAIVHGIKRLLGYFAPDANIVDMLVAEAVRPEGSASVPLAEFVGQTFGDQIAQHTVMAGWSSRLHSHLPEPMRDQLEELGFDKIFRRLLSKKAKQTP
jgi:hypothetical protein